MSKFIDNNIEKDFLLGLSSTLPPNIVVPKKQIILIEQSHDEVLACIGTKPVSNVENRTARETMGPEIFNIINNNGSCINTKDYKNSEAYIFPNNRKLAIIRDSFRGVGVPGLNNLLDQTISTLASFIEYHISYNKIDLKNPLDSTSPGGLGYQINNKTTLSIYNSETKINETINISLIHTAYFNYDLLIFRYICSTIGTRNNTSVDNLYQKMKDDKQPKLTPQEIIDINIININYLWQEILDFCIYAISSDKVIGESNEQNHKTSINALRYIVFTNFDKNKENYITNPTFKIITNTSNSNDVINYVETNIVRPKLTQLNDNKYPIKLTLLNDTPYISSQPMSATAITQLLMPTTKKIINKLKGCMSRKKKNLTDISNEVIHNINNLFKTYCQNKSIDLNTKNISAAGHAMLKFTGDTSHIVLYNILEKIKDRDKNYKFEILGLFSEIVGATRMICANKNVLITNNLLVFANNFNGSGSQNIGLPGYGIRIMFNLSYQYDAMYNSIKSKIVIVNNNANNYAQSTQLLNVLTKNEVYNEFVKFDKPNETPFVPDNNNAIEKRIKVMKELLNTKEYTDFVLRFNIDSKFVNIDTIIKEINVEIDEKYQFSNYVFSPSFRLTKEVEWTALCEILRSRSKIQIYDKIKNSYESTVSLINELVSLHSYITEYGDIKTNIDDIITKIQIIPNIKNLFKNIKNYYIVDEKQPVSYKTIQKVNSEKFIELTTAKWSKSKNNPDIIPESVSRLVNEFMSLIKNCIYLIDNFNIILSGGGVKSTKLDQPPLYQSGGDNEIFILAEDGNQTNKHENTIKDELYQTIKENLYLIPLNIDIPTIQEVPAEYYTYDKKYNIAMIETAITELTEKYKPKENIYDIYVDRIMYNFDILNTENVKEIITNDIKNFFEMVSGSLSIQKFFNFDTLNYDSIFKKLLNKLITKHNNDSFNTIWTKLNNWYNDNFNNGASVNIENMDMKKIIEKMFKDGLKSQPNQQNFITHINSTYKKTIFTENNLSNELNSIFTYIREYVINLNSLKEFERQIKKNNIELNDEKIIDILKLSFNLETAFNEIYRDRNTDSPMVLRNKTILTDIIVKYNLFGISTIKGGRHTRKKRKLSKQKTIKRNKKVKKSINIHTRRRRRDRKNTTKHRN